MRAEGKLYIDPKDLEDFRIMNIPVYKYSVYPFGNKKDIIVSVVHRPNIFRRFWMWFYFGWIFHRIKNTKDLNTLKY